MLCLSGFELYSRWVPLKFGDKMTGKLGWQFTRMDTYMCVHASHQKHARDCEARNGARKRGNNVAEGNVSLFAAQGNVSCGSKNVSEFVQKHFDSSTNVSSFAGALTCNSFPWNKAGDFRTPRLCPNMDKNKIEVARAGKGTSYITSE